MITYAGKEFVVNGKAVKNDDMKVIEAMLGNDLKIICTNPVTKEVLYLDEKNKKHWLFYRITAGVRKEEVAVLKELDNAAAMKFKTHVSTYYGSHAKQYIGNFSVVNKKVVESSDLTTIVSMLKNDLIEIGFDSATWDTLYRSNKDHAYWLLSREYGEMQGGGIKVLTEVDLETATRLKVRFNQKNAPHP